MDQIFHIQRYENLRKASKWNGEKKNGEKMIVIIREQAES